MEATSSTCQEIWIRRVLIDLGQEQFEETEIYCDKKATIALSKNLVYHGRTKHIDIRAHFIRDLVAEGTIILKYCGTDEQVADILTKPLPRNKHEYLSSLLGVCKFKSRGSVNN